MTNETDEILAVPCDCIGTCQYVAFHDLREPDGPAEVYVEFYAAYHGYTLKQRLSMIWKLIRGKEIWDHDMVLGPSQLTEMRDWMQKRLTA
jgi:hypothetical protein